MIEFKNVSKQFTNNNRQFFAVNDVSLTIQRGEIFGFIGYSGAGKSTLVRTINLLERPTSGEILIDGISMTTLNEKALREKRKDIGMIFQHFNLMASRTVYDNVALALHNASLSNGEKESRIGYLLELVGISDKRNAYPRQLSGGQKQRVAIARALANNPSILLCDEATSALDPQTTQNILELLLKLNRELNITIVMITHEMHVIKALCHRVAIMEQGRVKEINEVTSIFTNPVAPITKDFVDSTTNIKSIYDLIAHDPVSLDIKDSDILVKLTFNKDNTREAILSSLSKDYDVDASILFANVEVIQSNIIGIMVVKLRGSKINAALEDLTTRHVIWEVI